MPTWYQPPGTKPKLPTTPGEQRVKDYFSDVASGIKSISKPAGPSWLPEELRGVLGGMKGGATLGAGMVSETARLIPNDITSALGIPYRVESTGGPFSYTVKKGKASTGQMVSDLGWTASGGVFKGLANLAKTGKAARAVEDVAQAGRAPKGVDIIDLRDKPSKPGMGIVDTLKRESSRESHAGTAQRPSGNKVTFKDFKTGKEFNISTDVKRVRDWEEPTQAPDFPSSGGRGGGTTGKAPKGGGGVAVKEPDLMSELKLKSFVDAPEFTPPSTTIGVIPKTVEPPTLTLPKEVVPDAKLTATIPKMSADTTPGTVPSVPAPKLDKASKTGLDPKLEPKLEPKTRSPKTGVLTGTGKKRTNSFTAGMDFMGEATHVQRVY